MFYVVSGEDLWFDTGVSGAMPGTIGVFDSGVGGLTVLKALWERLPGLQTIYLGDTARVPYGTKSPDVVTTYSLRNAEFLAGCGIQFLVVACNTASAVALPSLETHLGIPVVGVIEPGAAAACSATKSGRVGVIGTPGTIQSGAYERAMRRIRPEVQVIARACPLFVPLAEEGWVSGEVPELVARKYLRPFRGEQIDTLVMGCTHYPLLQDVIGAVVGSDVELIDSATSTANRVAEVLGRLHGEPPVGREPEHKFFVTDVPERFREVGAKFLGRAIRSVEQVDVR